jgi:hypothetical protein
MNLIAASKAVTDLSVRIDTLWVFMAGAMVMLMQAGFLLLEVGF